MTTNISKAAPPSHHSVVELANAVTTSRSKDGSVAAQVNTNTKPKKLRRKPKRAGSNTSFKKNKNVLTSKQALTIVGKHIMDMPDEERNALFAPFLGSLHGGSTKGQGNESDVELAGSGVKLDATLNKANTPDYGGDLTKRSGGNIFYIISRFLKSDINGSQDEMIGALKQVAAQRNLYSMLNSNLAGVASTIKSDTAKEVSAAQKYQSEEHESFWDKLGDFLKSPGGIITLVVTAVVIVASVAVTALTAGAAAPLAAAGDAALEGGLDSLVAGGEVAGETGGEVAGDVGSDISSTIPGDGGDVGNLSDLDGFDDLDDVDDVGDTGTDGNNATENETQTNNTRVAETGEEAAQSTQKTESLLQKARSAWSSFSDSSFYKYGMRPLMRGLMAGGVVGGIAYNITKKSNSIQENPGFLKAQGGMDVAQTNTEILSNKISNVNNNIDQTEQTQINNPNQQMQAAANQISSEIGNMTKVESV